MTRPGDPRSPDHSPVTPPPEAAQRGRHVAMSSTRSLVGHALVLALMVVSTCLIIMRPATGFAAAPLVMPGGTAGVEAIPPVRILDSRTANGGHNGKFDADETFDLSVLNRGAVPASGVAAVLANVTVVSGIRDGYLTLFPAGATRPNASNINFGPQVVVANQFLVPVGADGKISIYSYASDVHVVIDVSGWVGSGPATTGGAVMAIVPNRILDSRTTNGGRNGAACHGGETAQVQVLGTHGLPSSGVSAVIANVTVAPDSTTEGYVTAYEAGALRPLASTVNFMRGVTTANMALIPIGKDGAINVFCSAGSMHVIIDVQGLVEDGDPAEGMGVKPVHPFRALDTRIAVNGQGGAPIGANSSIPVPVLGLGGLPLTGVAAVIAHLTAVGHTTPSGYLTAFPTGYVRPATSSLNFTLGATVSNAIVVPVGADGTISIFNLSGTTHAVLDIQGWIAAPNLTTAGPSVAFSTAPPYALADTQAAVYGYDPGTASQYEMLHATAQLALQSRDGHADGRTYTSDTEYNYEGREEHTAQLASQMYLTLYMRDHALVEFTDTSYWQP